MIAIILAVLVLLGVPAYVLERIRRRRRVDAFAEFAGVRRMPGESSTALIERATRRFRVIDRGARRG